MTAVSTAIQEGWVSAIVGYLIKKSLKGLKPGNLPQRIAVLAEANTLNQTGLPTKFQFTDSNAVGQQFGYGSPAHLIAKMLRPLSGDVLGGIQTLIYPLAETGTATSIPIEITGTATKNATHVLRVNGRTQVDGTAYAFTIETGDTATEIAPKIKDAIDRVLSAPCTAAVVADDCVATTKWTGLSSNEFNLSVEVGDNSAGITYALGTKVEGAGTPSITTALAAFGDEWNTMVVNGLGAVDTVIDALEVFNGNPNDADGRYTPSEFKPFKAYTGSSLTTLADATTLCDSRKLEVTLNTVPLPNTPAFTFEGAAEYVRRYATIAQNTPDQDPLNKVILTDTPSSADIGDFANPTARNEIVKVGHSTCKLTAESYEIIDSVTTYHPDTEPATAAFFKWDRDLTILWNIRYKYKLIEQINVIGKTIVKDESTSGGTGSISPARWKSIVGKEAESWEQANLIESAQVVKDTIEVATGESNKNRLETSFESSITGVARVIPTTNELIFKSV